MLARDMQLIKNIVNHTTLKNLHYAKSGHSSLSMDIFFSDTKISSFPKELRQHIFRKLRKLGLLPSVITLVINLLQTEIGNKSL